MKLSIFFALIISVISIHSNAHDKYGYQEYKPASGYESTNAVPVSGYTKQNGTYVDPYKRSAPDETKANNWSEKGNVNPYTGKAGTHY